MKISERSNLEVAQGLPDTAPLYAPKPEGALLPTIRLLWNRRPFLAKATLAGLLLAGLLSLLLPNEYLSTVQLMPPQPARGSGLAALAALAGKDSGLSMLGSELLGSNTTGAVFVGILRSRTVSDDLINRFDLRRVYRIKTYEAARNRLAEQTSILEDRKNGIIALTVTDRDPKRAADLAAAYVNELDKLSAGLTTSAAHRERVFLEERLKAVKQELDVAGRDLSDFSSKNSMLDVQEQAKAMVGAAATLQGQLIAAESQLKGLEAIYAPNNVRVRSTQARIAELKKQLNALAGQPGTALDNGSAQRELQIPSLRQLPALGVRWTELYLRAKIQDAVYQSLTLQYEMAKVEEAKEIPTVRVLDAPVLAERRSGPHRFAIAFFGAVLFFVGAVVWTVARATWDRIAPEDDRKMFMLEILDSVKISSRTALPWKSRTGRE